MNKNDLVTNHIPLVNSIANRLNEPHLKDDLIGEGMVALVKCAMKFNPDRGVTFGAYAKHRVKGTMIRFLDKNNSLSSVPIDGELDALGKDGQANRAMIKDALEYYLHPIEEWVITKRYFEKMSMDDIAELVGFKLSRVSQIHSNAIKKLRIAFISTGVEPQEESAGPDQPAALLQVVQKMFWDEYGVEVVL